MSASAMVPGPACAISTIGLYICMEHDARQPEWHMLSHLERQSALEWRLCNRACRHANFRKALTLHSTSSRQAQRHEGRQDFSSFNLVHLSQSRLSFAIYFASHSTPHNFAHLCDDTVARAHPFVDIVDEATRLDRHAIDSGGRRQLP